MRYSRGREIRYEKYAAAKFHLISFRGRNFFYFFLQILSMIYQMLNLNNFFYTPAFFLSNVIKERETNQAIALLTSSRYIVYNEKNKYFWTHIRCSTYNYRYLAEDISLTKLVSRSFTMSDRFSLFLSSLAMRRMERTIGRDRPRLRTYVWHLSETTFAFRTFFRAKEVNLATSKQYKLEIRRG